MKLEYMGGDRPWYMTRKGRREMQENLTTEASHVSTFPIPDPTLENNPEGSNALRSAARCSGERRRVAALYHGDLAVTIENPLSKKRMRYWEGVSFSI